MISCPSRVIDFVAFKDFTLLLDIEIVEFRLKPKRINLSGDARIEIFIEASLCMVTYARIPDMYPAGQIRLWL
jgi:hypothetical protein